LTDDLPTPRTTLRARCVTLLVWCKGGLPASGGRRSAPPRGGWARRRAADAAAVDAGQQLRLGCQPAAAVMTHPGQDVAQRPGPPSGVRLDASESSPGLLLKLLRPDNVTAIIALALLGVNIVLVFSRGDVPAGFASAFTLVSGFISVALVLDKVWDPALELPHAVPSLI
jgi:hypothetical protein